MAAKRRGNGKALKLSKAEFFRQSSALLETPLIADLVTKGKGDHWGEQRGGHVRSKVISN